MKSKHTMKTTMRLLIALTAMAGCLVTAPGRADAQYPEPSIAWWAFHPIGGTPVRNDPLNVMVYSSYNNFNNYGQNTKLLPRLVSIGWGTTVGNTVNAYDQYGTYRGQDNTYAKGGIACTGFRCRPKLRLWDLSDGLWDHSMIAVADTHCCNLWPPAHYLDDFESSQDNLAADIVATKPVGSGHTWWTATKSPPHCAGNGNTPTSYPSLPCSSYKNVGYADPVYWSGNVEFILLT